ncbi:fimbria/pilus outer membrane usher protein [Burkholderia diffusa]|uniref:fimbria/pilus outer membrane usher protein n=1 Tax=Burkholderia diffusa TaxID=488732 RepID=UPI000751D873|nr:fimbria/pilus outer membrane usher protein [Burkholderia diffusa]KVH45674.1 fimbrial assembly protein [Burkholderia diffusa]
MYFHSPEVKLNAITTALVGMLVCGTAAANNAAIGPSTSAAEINFNDQLLYPIGGGRVDISRFNKGNVILPGTYRADLYVNQAWVGRVEVVMRSVSDDARNVQACFDQALLERVGVDLTKLTADASSRLAATRCAPLQELVPAAIAQFDMGEQRLDVSVPQAAQTRSARGYVDPRYWDDGVTAARLQYNANVYSYSSGGVSTTSGYLGLAAGMNVGAWRFRHLGNISFDSRNGNHYQSIQTYVERSLAGLRSRLTVGDAFTDGSVFDSFGFRGVQLASDDRMYPDSQRGYAPTIHGIANTSARVQVRQNGNIIYETTVAPGAFVIDDLYPTGYGSDLEVVVTEADGSVHISKVPYAAAVNSLRPGITRYEFTAGQYRNTNTTRDPKLFQATVQHGLTNLLTVYGGLLAAQGYTAGSVGAALNTGFGAFGLDITQAWTRLQGLPDRSGYSVRLAYSKLIELTGTNFSVAAYRYSSSGYLGLADAVALSNTETGALTSIQRHRVQLTMSQTLPQGYGSFYVTGSTQNYWNRSGSDTQFQVGYNNSFRRITYGISASRQFDLTTSRWDNRFLINVAIPLGIGSHAPYSTTSLQRDTRSSFDLQQSVTGALGVDNSFTYGLRMDQSGGNGAPNNTSLGGNVSYLSPIATITANASTSRTYRQAGAGLSGGVVAYAGGVAFTPVMGETMAIIEAKDAVGARVANRNGLRIDPWGHTIVSSLTPFASNVIEIDPKGLPVQVELKSTEQHVAPTAGAIVRMRFETENVGRTAIFEAHTLEGKPVPFGAEVFDSNGQSVGIVAQSGRVIAHKLSNNSGMLIIKWGDSASERCSVAYTLPDVAATAEAMSRMMKGMVCQ